MDKKKDVMPNRFIYKDFSCEVDTFKNGKDVILRFYDASREQKEEEIQDYVVVDSGYGFLCLKYKGDSALLSGYLCKSVFCTDEMIDAAIEFLENISPESKNLYMPYHIECVEVMNDVEYNGEY